MSPLLRWSHHAPALDQDDWVIVPAELDLTEAVTLVATVSAQLPEAKPFNDPPPHSFKYALIWSLQDSLTGSDWHRLTGGRLTTSGQDIARVSTPLGTSARVAFRADGMGCMDPRGDRWEYGWSHIWGEMGLDRPTEIKIDIVVRTL